MFKHNTPKSNFLLSQWELVKVDVQELILPHGKNKLPLPPVQLLLRLISCQVTQGTIYINSHKEQQRLKGPVFSIKRSFPLCSIKWAITSQSVVHISRGVYDLGGTEENNGGNKWHMYVLASLL